MKAYGIKGAIYIEFSSHSKTKNFGNKMKIIFLIGFISISGASIDSSLAIPGNSLKMIMIDPYLN